MRSFTQGSLVAHPEILVSGVHKRGGEHCFSSEMSRNGCGLYCFLSYKCGPEPPPPKSATGDTYFCSDKRNDFRIQTEILEKGIIGFDPSLRN